MPSYRELEPIERGGEISRIGLEFQDHVASGYCIKMVQDPHLVEVWCESLDDITLIRRNGDIEEFEFVQAKSNQLNHLWSASELCKRKKSNVGSSILEKSLANERAKEAVSFRIVTCLGVNKELEILTFPLNSPKRAGDALTGLCQNIAEKIPNYTSPNGNGTDFWLSRTVWEICHSSKAVEDANIRKLQKVCENMNFYLVADQLAELYQKILRKIQDAGKAEWQFDPEAKKIKQNDFRELIKQWSYQAQHPGIGGTGNKLREKMEIARISSGLIETAQEQRRFYRIRTLNPSYMDLSKREELEMETQAELHNLKAKLDAGKLGDTGVEFHSRCLESLKQIQAKTENVPLSILQGYMYNLTDRCLHRFTRETL